MLFHEHSCFGESDQSVTIQGSQCQLTFLLTPFWPIRDCGGEILWKDYLSLIIEAIKQCIRLKWYHYHLNNLDFLKDWRREKNLINFDFKFEFLSYVPPEYKISNLHLSVYLHNYSLYVECSSCPLQDSKLSLLGPCSMWSPLWNLSQFHR